MYRRRKMENKRLKKTILQVVIAAVLLGEMKEFSEESCRNGLDEMPEDYGLSGQEEPWSGMCGTVGAGGYCAG